MDSMLNPLLRLPTDEELSTYFKKVLEDHPGLEVRLDAGGGRGKGLFVTQSFQQGEAIFAERPLVAGQSRISRISSPICSHCHRQVGTIELLTARLLLRLILQLNSGEIEDDLPLRLAKVEAAVGEGGSRLSGLLDGSLALPHSSDFPLPAPVACRGGCDECYCSEACEGKAWEQQHCLLCPAAPGAVAEVQQAVLSSLAGPRASVAKGRSKSKGAAKHHGSCGDASCSHDHNDPGAGSSSSSSAQPGSSVPSEMHGVRVDRQLLRAFYEHADETNEIFVVAAKLIAGVLVAADVALQEQQAATQPPPVKPHEPPAGVEQVQAGAPAATLQEDAAVATADVTTRLAAATLLHQTVQHSQLSAQDVEGPSTKSSEHADAIQGRPEAAQHPVQHTAHLDATPDLAHSRQAGVDSTATTSGHPQGTSFTTSTPAQEDARLRALLHAWRPYAMGHKRVWWEAVAVPEDVEDEAEFRGQLRGLAEDSLALLRAALQQERFPELFDLQVYGSIIGMFELNNLTLTIPSPLEDYFMLLADWTPEQRRAPGARAAQLMLDALDDDYDTPAEGTAFFALQSCANHSCAPAARADGEPDGCITLTAMSDLAPGDELTISYIDEIAPREERQSDLRDYGFTCACARCLAGDEADPVLADGDSSAEDEP